MAKKEQVQPSPTTDALDIDREKDLAVQNPRRRRSFLKSCGIVAAITVVIMAIVMITLAFTVFQVRGPIVKIDSVTTVGIENNTLTLLANVSMKNPNAIAYRYDNSTTTVFYGGVSVGEGEILAGLARAKRTVMTNLTVAISMNNVMDSPRFTNDFIAGSVTMESFTTLEGTVKLANMITKKVVVKLNCTMVYGIFTSTVEKQECTNEISI